MTSTTLLSDIVLPAATWYEKYDLSSTDMHPFVHAFTPAIDPPWEAKSDFEAFHPCRRGPVVVRLPAEHRGDGRGVAGLHIHTLVGMLLFCLWPFTRLVHAFTAPLHYLFRPYIVYRSRDQHTGPGATAGHRGWDPVGTRDRTSKRRDNAALLDGEVTLRYGWPDVTERPCQIAWEVAAILAARGWPGLPTRCARCASATDADLRSG